MPSMLNNLRSNRLNESPARRRGNPTMTAERESTSTGLNESPRPKAEKYQVD